MRNHPAPSRMPGIVPALPPPPRGRRAIPWRSWPTVPAEPPFGEHTWERAPHRAWRTARRDTRGVGRRYRPVRRLAAVTPGRVGPTGSRQLGRSTPPS
jgi:hypothetical protein